MPRLVAIASLCLALVAPSAWAAPQKEQPRAEDINWPVVPARAV